MVERVHFWQRFRHDEESVVRFRNALRGLASHCEFGPSLAERLRDQLVIGNNNTTWQQELLRLFPTNDATLQQVEDAVTRLELADVQQMQLQNSARAVNGSAIRRVKEQTWWHVNRVPGCGAHEQKRDTEGFQTKTGAIRTQTAGGRSTMKSNGPHQSSAWGNPQGRSEFVAISR
uniref:Retrotransposon gag domain-containing protein n=1 Tax=Trichuris muris TaxID=70415 RepID=A0A5S6QJL9_TRIMR